MPVHFHAGPRRNVTHPAIERDTDPLFPRNTFDANPTKQRGAEHHWNDPDMMEVGNGGMTIEEYRTHMTLWVILAAPLLVGNDPRTMTNDIKELLLNREVLAVNQDTLGKQGRRLIRNGTTEIWAKPLSGEAVAVALFNRGASRTQVSVRWSELGLNGQYKARDLWKRLDLPDATNSYSAGAVAGSVL